MKKSLIQVVLATAAASSLLLVAGCPGPGSTGPIKIGAMLPLTGPAAFYGEWAQKGMQLAVEEVNAAGGIRGRRLDIDYGDTKNEPKEGAALANKFVSAKLPVIISAMTGVSFAAVPIADQSNTLLFMTVVTHPEAAAQSKWAFRHYVNKGRAAEVMARYARQSLRLERIAVLQVNDEGGLGEVSAFRAEFERLGGSVIAVETFERTASDVRQQLSKLAGSRPEAIYISGYGRVYGVALKQASELAIGARILASYEPLYRTTREIAGAAIEGVVFSAPYFDDDNPEAVAFKRKYEARFREAPELDAAYGYDVVMMLAEATTAVGVKPEKIREYLLKIRGFRGVVGTVNAQPDGDFVTPVVIKTIKGGAITTLQN